MGNEKLNKKHLKLNSIHTFGLGAPKWNAESNTKACT